jgi:hypothetical protein
MKSNEICRVYESSYRCGADVASLKSVVINCIVALRAMRDGRSSQRDVDSWLSTHSNKVWRPNYLKPE